MPSSLLRKKDGEVRLFSNLYSQTRSFDENGKQVADGSRTTYFTEFLQLTYGLSNRLNIGLDFTFKSVYRDLTSGSPFRVFQFENNSHAQTAITAGGPKIRWMPFEQLPRFTVQSTLYFPLGNDLEGSESGRPFLDYDRLFSWTQFYYDRFLTNDLQLFAGMDIWFRTDFNFSRDQLVLSTPLKLILNYFPHSSMVVYGLGEYAPTYGDGFISYDYFQAGVGAKYFVGENFEVEALVSEFLLGSNTGAGYTLNVGVRYVLK